MNKKIVESKPKARLKPQSEKFPNLKPITQVVTFHLPSQTIERVKVKANSCGVSYQSLIKVWLYEKLSA